MRQYSLGPTLLEVDRPEGADAQATAPHQIIWTLERSAASAFITNDRGVIQYVNPAFVQLTGYSRLEAIGQKPSLLKSGQNSPEIYRRLWHTLRSGEEFRSTLINRKKNGQNFHEAKVIRPLFDAQGRVTHFMSEGHDITERVQEMNDLVHAASHDSLTGLPNRSLFLDRLERAMRHAERNGQSFALAIVDIDRFKRVNDAFGHPVGDAVLCGVALRLLHRVREADTVARLGGDEYALLLLDVSDHDAARRVLRHVLAAFATGVLAAGHELNVSISVGACLYPSDCTSEAELIWCADAAMYRAKQSGGNSFEIGCVGAPR